MLEKAREMIDNIEQNEYLTATEALLLSMLHDLLQPENDEDEGEEDDDRVSASTGG